MIDAAGRQLDVRLEAVDSNGLLPMRAVSTVFPTAYAFRRSLQKTLPAHLQGNGLRPIRSPSRSRRRPRRCRADIAARWPDAFTWLDGGGSLARLPIDHEVRRDRPDAAARRRRTAASRPSSIDELPGYGDDRNVPDRDATSRLSPYLHWGHLGPHEVFDRLMTREGWLGDLPSKATGSREGWWGVSPAAEAFLDELITWRELGFNLASQRPDYDRLRLAAGVGASDARGARRGPARAPLHARGVRARRHARSALERRAAPARRERAASTTTCACCGARRSSSGRPHRARRWR